jgi:putative hemolysin
MVPGAPRGESRSLPLIARLLSGSMAIVLRRLGIRPSTEPRVTEEEIEALLKEGTQAGVFEEAEHEIVRRAFRLGHHRASELMTPMQEVVWLDIADSPDVMRRQITESPHNRYPVCEGSIDNILGIVGVMDLLVHILCGRPFGIQGLLKIPHFIYEGTPALRVLEMFKKSGMHVAVVLDEYGSVRGLLTLTDILEAIVGDMPVGDDQDEPKAVQQTDGSWLLDGMITLEEFQDLLGIDKLPEGDYQTLAGFVISQMGRIPAAADRFEWGGYSFEVIDMEGHRVDKVSVTPQHCMMMLEYKKSFLSDFLKKKLGRQS